MRGYFEKLVELGYLYNSGFYIKPDVIKDEDYGRELTVEDIKKIVWGKKPELGDDFKENYYD